MIFAKRKNLKLVIYWKYSNIMHWSVSEEWDYIESMFKFNFLIRSSRKWCLKLILMGTVKYFAKSLFQFQYPMFPGGKIIIFSILLHFQVTYEEFLAMMTAE